MANFPASPTPQYPLGITQKWRTIVSQFDGGGEQRRRKSAFPTYDVVVTYGALSPDEVDTLWDFYNEMGGAYKEFYFFTILTESHKGLYVGIGDGTTTIFDIPGIIDGPATVYVDGLPGSYSLLTGGGAGGSDRVEFTTAPVENAIISCDIIGTHRIRCRFAEDEMTKELFAYRLYSTGLKLKGLAG
jgi:hypothetical protein